MGTDTGTYDQLVHFGANQMIPGEEIRIDEFGNTRFWFVAHPKPYGPVKFISEDGEMFWVHRAFAMTLKQYEDACKMRERARIMFDKINLKFGITL